MNWPRSKSINRNMAQILMWAQEQMKQGVSRQAICIQLLNVDTGKMSLDEMQAYLEAERELSGVMVNRNLRGKMLEKSDHIDEAAALYEENIEDKFIGSHPYERLRIIYTKRKDYVSAIRVCRAYLNLPTKEGKKRIRFQDHLEKLVDRTSQ